MMMSVSSKMTINRQFSPFKSHKNVLVNLWTRNVMCLHPQIILGVHLYARLHVISHKGDIE